MKPSAIRILIVVDEPLVRNVVRAMLERKGFVLDDVSLCIKPRDADSCELKCFESCDEPHLIIIEIILPRACSGVRVANKALRRWPGVKILLTSASPRELWSADAAHSFEALPSGSCAFLAKPFTVCQMDAAIKRLLPDPT